MDKEFITDLNESITEGLPTPKTKFSDMLPRLAGLIHIIEMIFQNEERTYLPEEISIETTEKARYMLDTLEQQKEMFTGVSYFN